MQSQPKIIFLSLVIIIITVNTGLLYGQLETQTKFSTIQQPFFSLATVLSIENSSSALSSKLSLPLQDSIRVTKSKIKLLPYRLSLIEGALWGESGILRSTGIAPLTPSARKIELTYRRTVLSMHQIGGFTTLALFIPTLIYGQQNINMRNAAAEGRGTFDQNLANKHKTLGELTFGVYMTTAAFAIFSPPPLIRRNEWSTISTHKTLALIHFTGMIATPLLAILAYHAKSYESERSLQKAHQITAYVTAAALAASMIIVTF